MLSGITSASLFAAASCGSGLLLLLASWRQRAGGRGWLITGGWLLILLSLPLWFQAVGWEFGSVYFLILLALLAWPLVGLQTERCTQPVVKPPRQPLHKPAWPALAHTAARQLTTFVIAVPVTGLLSIVICFAVATLLPWQEVDKLALVVLIMPVVWGLFMAWYCIDARPARPVTVLLAAGLMAGFLLMR